MGSNYDADVMAWASERSAPLRAGKLSDLDVEHIAEELEEQTAGKSSIVALSAVALIFTQF